MRDRPHRARDVGEKLIASAVLLERDEIGVCEHKPRLGSGGRPGSQSRVAGTSRKGS